MSLTVGNGGTLHKTVIRLNRETNPGSQVGQRAFGEVHTQANVQLMGWHALHLWLRVDRSASLVFI